MPRRKVARARNVGDPGALCALDVAAGVGPFSAAPARPSARRPVNAGERRRESDARGRRSATHRAPIARHPAEIECLYPGSAARSSALNYPAVNVRRALVKGKQVAARFCCAPTIGSARLFYKHSTLKRHVYITMHIYIYVCINALVLVDGECIYIYSSSGENSAPAMMRPLCAPTFLRSRVCFLLHKRDLYDYFKCRS